MGTEVLQRLRQFDRYSVGTLVLALAFAVLAIPTFVTLGGDTWSREEGAHGPLVLSTGAWLIWRQRLEVDRLAASGSSWVTAALLVPSLALYVFGRAYDFITFEVAGVYGVGLTMFQARFGAKAMFARWFPLLYLGFLVPPPKFLLDSLTAPLKQFVSLASTEALKMFGIPVAREGVIIFVAQYQLLVEDACSGLQSIVGLTAIGLFYVYLLRSSSPAYALFLTALIIPIAIAANVVRVAFLILLTYFFGDAVAQGFLHFAAGIFLFATALLLVFAVDHLAHALRPSPRPKA